MRCDKSSDWLEGNQKEILIFVRIFDRIYRIKIFDNNIKKKSWFGILWIN